MLLYLLAFIVLGLISATFSYYNKNYYVGVFNDILGKEEDERAATRVGRGFIYGFFFLIYLALIVIGLIVLLGFLIIAGIIAAIIFVMVWVTENILPNEWFGNLLLQLYSKIGLGQAAPPATSAEVPVPSQPNSPMPSPSAPPPTTDTSSPEAEKTVSKQEEPGINVTRRHTLD